MASPLLIYDVESSETLFAGFGKQYEPRITRVVRPSYMYCFAYKWYGQDHVTVHKITDYPTYKTDPHNDYYLVKTLHSLFKNAHTIIGYNGDNFDQKYSQGRFIHHGLEPATEYNQFDPLKVVRSRFKFESNRMDYVAKMLGLEGKKQVGGQYLWERCDSGEIEAFDLMGEYNEQDVIVLENIYEKIRPWAKTHPTVQALEIGNTRACPRCGSGKLENRGIRRTKVNAYRRLRCRACDSFSRERLALDTAKPEVVN